MNDSKLRLIFYINSKRSVNPRKHKHEKIQILYHFYLSFNSLCTITNRKMSAKLIMHSITYNKECNQYVFAKFANQFIKIQLTKIIIGKNDEPLFHSHS